MKRISKKMSVLVVALLAIGSVVFTNASKIGIGIDGYQWDNMNFISQTFWNEGPSSGELIQALFGTPTTGTTAYTQNRSGYTAGDCSGKNMTVHYVDPGTFGTFSEAITGNQIFVLNSGYYNTDTTIELSGSCIGIIGSGNVEIDGSRIITNATKTIIDNIQGPQIVVTKKTYTNTGNEQIGIALNTLGYDAYAKIAGDIQTVITGVLLDNGITTGDITLTNGDGVKNISIILETGNIFLNRFSTSINLLTTKPTFTANRQDGIAVVSGSVYNTGVVINFTTGTIASATVNGVPYIGGDIISEENNYVFLLTDKAGNTGGISFVIDYTAPLFTGTLSGGTIITSGGIYNTGFSFTFSDANLLGATINGAPYTSGELIISAREHTFVVTDKAGNSTGIKFSIDLTAPNCTPISPESGANISAASLNLRWNCGDNLGVDSLNNQTLSIYTTGGALVYTTGFTKTGAAFDYYTESNSYDWSVSTSDKAGNQYTMPLQRVNYIKPIIINLQHGGYLYQNNYYVSGSNITFSWTGNMSFLYQFTGTIVDTAEYVYTYGTTKTRTISLSGADGVKTVIMNYGTGTQTGAKGPISFYLDRVSPIITGNYPTPLLKTKQTTINFQRTATDTGAGIVGYSLEFGGNEVYSGTATSYILSNITGGTYQWKIIATDRAGNKKETAPTLLTVDNSFPQIGGVTGNTYYNTSVTPIFTAGTTGVLNGVPFTSNTMISTDNDYRLVVTNDMGNSTTVNFTIDKQSPTISLNNPTNGQVSTGNNNVTFSRNGIDANMSGYIFSLYGVPNATEVTTTTNNVTLSNLPNNNNYMWKVKAIDKAGNETTATGQSFVVNLTLNGTVGITGTITSGGMAYTNTTFGIQILSNKNASINIGGNLSGANAIGTSIAGTNTTILVTPSVGDGIKTFSILANTGSESFTGSVVGYLDTTAPSTPTFTGQATTYSGAFTLGWLASNDLGVGMGDYVYTVMSGNSVVKTGTTLITNISFTNLEIGTTGNYVFSVSARDKLGNTSIGGTMTFAYSAIEDKVPDSFSLDKEYDADLDVEIKSNKITVAGLSTGTKVLASVDEGTLFVNGNDVGTEFLVKNGDRVQIALQSSSDYDDITSGVLTIGEKSSTFKIQTIADDNGSSNSSYDISELSTTQKLHISIIYNTLSELYSDSKQEDFMLSMKELVKDKIDQMESDDEDTESIETMMYLYNLINKDFEGDNGSSSDTYTAPNGKDYKITKSSNGYTSSNFIKTKYFNTRDEIETYIDKNNPKNVYVGGDYAIDQSRSSSTYTAPNGKVYNFFKTTTGKYGSSNFATAKLFNDIATMKKHININNPKK